LYIKFKLFGNIEGGLLTDTHPNTLFTKNTHPAVYFPAITLSTCKTRVICVPKFDTYAKHLLRTGTHHCGGGICPSSFYIKTKHCIVFWDIFFGKTEKVCENTSKNKTQNILLQTL